MEQYLPTLPEDMSSRPVLGRVLVAQSLFFCVMSCRFYFVLLSFSFDHCVVCPSLTFGFWLPLWYLLTIVLSVLLWLSASDYPFGIFWLLCCLSFFDFRLLITPLVSFDHCVVCPSLTFGFWLPLWYLLTIVLSVLLWLSASDYPFGIFWPLCCLSFFDFRLLITPLVSFYHCVVCPSLTFGFWLPLWYLLTIVLSVLLWLSASDYLPLVSSNFSSDEEVFFVFHFIIHTFSMFFFSICCGIYNFLNFCVSSIVEHWYFIHKWYFQCIQLGVTQLIGCLYWPIHEDAITVINESPTIQ